MIDTNLKYTNYIQFREQWLAGTFSCIDWTQFYLDNIRKKSALNAFIEVFEKEALAKAEELEEKKQADKPLGRLAGMVIGIKDLICYKDHALNAASLILDGFVSQFSATVVSKLLKEDAIIIGRLNCDQFGMGSGNKNSHFGAVKNPHDPKKVAGGSSGGSAVAVAADLCMATLGTDTGGSIRLPSSFCGIVGCKPTYSRVSRYGLVSFASSFDTIGPLAKSSTDIALLLETIAGQDEGDSTVSRKPVPAYSKAISDLPAKVKIGYFKKVMDFPEVQKEVKETFQNTIDKLGETHEMIPIELPYLKRCLPTYYILTNAEASTNLSRYDGIRYGFQNEEKYKLEEMYKRRRGTGFSEEVKRRILLGTFVLSANYYDTFFTKAQKVRRLIAEGFEKLFQTCDIILLPTSPTTAPLIEQQETDNPLQEYLTDIFNVPASLSGLPAISFPMGKDQNDMPIGMQLIAPNFQEERLFQIVRSLE